MFNPIPAGPLYGGEGGGEGGYMVPYPYINI